MEETACEMMGGGGLVEMGEGLRELSYESQGSADQVYYPGCGRCPSQPVQRACVDQDGDTSMSSVQAWSICAGVWMDGGLSRSRWSQSLRSYCCLGGGLGEEAQRLHAEVICEGLRRGQRAMLTDSERSTIPGTSPRKGLVRGTPSAQLRSSTFNIWCCLTFLQMSRINTYDNQKKKTPQTDRIAFSSHIKRY